MALAIEFGSPCIAFFTTSQNDPISWKLKEVLSRATVNIKVHEIHIGDSYSGHEFLHISKEILVMNKSGSCVVVLDCGAKLATFIHQVTRSLDIPVRKFFWVMFDETFSNHLEESDQLPEGLLKLRNANTIEDLISDGIQLVDRSIAALGWKGFNGTNSSCLGSLTPWIDGSKLFQ